VSPLHSAAFCGGPVDGAISGRVFKGNDSSKKLAISKPFPVGFSKGTILQKKKKLAIPNHFCNLRDLRTQMEAQTA